MNFDDIPQLTRTSGYQINVGLNYLEDELKSWIEDSHLQLNPDFQRGHVWNEAQQIKFVEYLLRGGVSSRMCYFNHPNWLTNPTVGDFVCVDGLQRITACCKFMNNEIKVFGHYQSEFEGRIPTHIGLIFVVNDLKTRREVLQWYIEMNEGGTVHSKAEIDRVKGLLEAEPAFDK